MNVCRCPHHKLIPMVIFIIGLLFFLNAVNLVITTSVLNMLWPVALMIGGLTKMMSSRCKCCGRM